MSSDTHGILHEILLAAVMLAWVKQACCASKFTIQNWMYNNTDDNERETKGISIYESYYRKNDIQLEDTDM